MPDTEEPMTFATPEEELEYRVEQLAKNDAELREILRQDIVIERPLPA